jgi:CelD/BcsL family acetyltransferase involved in cellulose biosynthesis
VLRREGNPVVDLAGDFEQHLAGCSSNFRRQVRARDRRLSRRYDVRFRLCTDRAALPGALDSLERLHAAQFGKQSGFLGPTARFHRVFAALALERGWLRLWTLELDGQPVAAHYGFRYGGVESFYQSGRAPGFERDSLGTVMLTHAIRSAAADGIRTFALLRGHERYKYRFATSDHGLETICTSRGRFATTAVAALEALTLSNTMRAALRRRLET